MIRRRSRSVWAAANKRPACPPRRCRPSPPVPDAEMIEDVDGGTDAVERERVPHRSAAAVIRPVDDHKSALGGQRRNAGSRWWVR